MTHNTPRPVKIAGLGKYLPERVVRSDELERELGLEAGWIAKRTGVVERRRIADGETQSQMGAAAARAALADAGWGAADAGDLGLIVCASGGMEQAIPCTAALLQRELGLAAAGVPCFDVNATCLSFLVALDLAANYVELGAYASVLVVSTEASSVAIDWTEHESAVLLGDGAAAALVTRAAAGESSAMYRASVTTDSRGVGLAEVKGCGTARHPNRPDVPPASNLFHMQGPQIVRYALKQSVPFIARYAATLPFPLADLRALCAHQASLFAVRMGARACGFRDDQVIENIATHGNCVAASIPMVLHDGVREGRIARGDRVLLAGTAAGVAVGALALVY
jgi:3-oxoacyl-[acyl-carrier-protein] synthase-3